MGAFHFGGVVSSFHPSVEVEPVRHFQFQYHAITALRIHRVHISMKGVASPVARILAEGMQAHVGIDAVGYGGIVAYVPLSTSGGIPFGILGTGNG